MAHLIQERFWSRRRFVIGSLLIVAMLAGIAVFFDNRTGSQFQDHPADDFLLAGRVAIQKGDYQAALAKFAQAEAKAELPIAILFDRAQTLLQLGQAMAAEQQLSELLARDPQHVAANELLCGLLRVAGRNWEIRPHFLELVRQDVFSAGNLAAIVSNDNIAVNRGTPDETQIEQFLVHNATLHDNTVAQLRNARYLQAENSPERAISALQKIVHEGPGFLDAQSRLGGLLLETSRWEDFRLWHNELPKNAWSYPDIWFVHGRWAEHCGDRRAAARCYWETLRLYPDHPTATYRLSQMLLALGHRAEATEFAERAGIINEIQTAIATGWNPPSNIQVLAENLESVGRLWESLGWSMLTIKWSPIDETWAHERAQRLRDLVNVDTPLVLDASNLALKIDLSDWPLPDANYAPPSPDEKSLDSTLNNRIEYVDLAERAGISFSYHNGADPERAYMFEFGGGGVAVLDYDGDGWPDLYLTQGCDWPVSATQQRYTDRLFRNLGNGRFEDVTQRASINGNGFGQGVAVGDIDDDGWPDLYIANIGMNRLYRNNGDGTFSDLTTQAGITAAEWTLSTLIADLNGDRFPELYDVNYLGGPAVFNEICYENDRPIQCFPNQFPGEPDRVYQSIGNGSFRDVSEEAGIALPDGKGMGVVAADFDGSRRISLFIANDTTNNNFFLNQTPSIGGELRFKEQGLPLGLALGETGTAGSCMGIAIGDANGDNRLDLFVTNFRDEANNLFMQGDDLFFDDHIRSSRLRDPGYRLEGWGAQFIDGDQDGWLDLAVANGHLDDYPHSTGIKKMPTQFFRNLGHGQFVELPAAELGPHFQKPRLGRALARLDWNRDGRPDFCMTQVTEPFALLTNQTAECGHFLTVHLRGVESSRDAVGTTVTVRTDGLSRSLQLTAGDGYQASNQRCLQFGLAKAELVDELTIDWPSGAKQVFSDIGVNREIICVESQNALPLRGNSMRH